MHLGTDLMRFLVMAIAVLLMPVVIVLGTITNAVVLLWMFVRRLWDR